MIKKLLIFLRDCSLLALLIFLVKTVWVENVSFLNDHRDSLIHELDKDFLDLIYTTKTHIHALQDHPAYGADYAQQLANLKERVVIIEEKYKKNSPGLALLGPLGTTSIVLKEQELQKKLLAIINEISTILQLEHKSDTLSCSQAINKNLSYNKKIIKRLVT